MTIAPTDGPPASAVMTSIGGRLVPMRVEPNCRTCQSKHRAYIEQQLLLGYSYTSIAKEISVMAPGPLPHPDAASISHHTKNQHMPLESNLARGLIEKRAEDIGRDLSEGSTTLVDKVTVAEAVVQQTYERMVRGEIKPTLQDFAQAAKFLQSVEDRVDGGLNEQAWADAMGVFFDVIMPYVPVEFHAEITRKLVRNPILKAIQAAQNDQVIDVEVDEEPPPA